MRESPTRNGQNGSRRSPWRSPLGMGMLSIALVAIVGFTAFRWVRGVADANPDIVGRGERLYQTECQSCHGPTGERLPVSPLSSKEFLDTRGDATLMAVITEGKGVMPAFGTVRGGPLQEPEVRAIVAYLNFKAGRQSTSVLADAGKEVFVANCTRCHGPNGDRIPIAPLNAKGFLDMRTDGDMREAIENGKGVMPPMASGKGGKLSKTNTDAVISYLRHSVEQRTALIASRGRELYLGNCLQCHGNEGNRIPGINLAQAAYLQSVGDGAILLSVAEGKGVMPAFGTAKGGMMGVGEIASLLTYVKTWAGVNASSALVTGAMPGMGQELFFRNCIACHGRGGDQVPGIRLLSKEFLAREDAVLVQTITRGNAKGMPAWGIEAGGPLTQGQIQSVVDFLKASAQSEGVTNPAPGSAIGGGPTGPLIPVTAATVAKGKEIFTTTCVACHGETRDKIPTCRLADPAFFAERGDATLINSVTFGKGPMPSWGMAKGGPLGPDDVKAVLAYLKNAGGAAEVSQTASTGSTAPTTSSGSATASAELVTQGKELFNSTCAMCHGETRDKVPTCQLASRDWLKKQTFDGLIADITNGKPPMMPTWGKSKGGNMSDDQIKAIATYIWDAAGMFGSSSAAPAPTGGPYTAEMVTKGKAAFNSTCAMCHGETRDKVPTCQLASPDWLKKQTWPGLIADITNGKPPMMPTWGKAKGGSLADDQIKEIAAYIWDAAGLSPADIGSGSATGTATSGFAADVVAKGKTVFNTNCAMCHGETRDKVPTCQLANPDWLAQKTFEGVIKDATEGKPPMMPAWGGKLSPEDIKAAVSYVFDAAGLGPDSKPVGTAGLSDTKLSADFNAILPTPTPLPKPTVASVETGRQIFMGICRMCHGENGLNIPQCPLGSREWLSNMSQEGLLARIRRGKPSQGMPTWGEAYGGPLSDIETLSVAMYLGSVAK